MREAVLVLLPAVAIVWIALRLFDLELRKLQPAWERWLVGAAALLGGLWLVAVLACWFAGWMSQGTWFCPVCGAIEERTTYFGFTVNQGSSPEDDEVEAARRYARWCADVVPVGHVHDWIPTGCHGSFSSVACAPRVNDSLFHVTLPRAPDGEVARVLAQRLAAALLERRRAMLMDFNGCETGPFAELLRAPITREGFTEQYPTWLAEHPLWQ